MRGYNRIRQSSMLEESIVKFLKKQHHCEKVPVDETWYLCIMEGNCNYSVKTEYGHKQIKLCRRIGC